MSGGLDSFLSARITVKNILLLIFLATAWPVVFHLFRPVRGARLLQQFGSEIGQLFLATAAVGSALALVFPLTSVTGSVTVGDLRHFWLASFAFCLLVRVGRRAVDHARTPVTFDERSSSGPVASPSAPTATSAARAADRLRSGRLRRRTRPMDARNPIAFRRRRLAPLDELEQILMRQVIDEVVIALPVKSCYQQIQHAIGVCERAGVQAKYGADLFESTVAFPRYDAQGDRAFVAMQVAPDGYRLVIKRAIDIVGAVVGLVVFAPLMLIVAVAIKLTSRRSDRLRAGPVRPQQTTVPDVQVPVDGRGCRAAAGLTRGAERGERTGVQDRG